MGRFVNPDNSAFKDALNSDIYVDKSGLINYLNKVMCSSEKFICNSRPRRFGKSMTANMIAAYYSKGADSDSLFSSLEIGSSADYKKHLNKYDVIHFDVQWCINPAGDVERVIPYIESSIIGELKEYYPELINNEDKSLPEVLSRINNKTGSKFVFIIDEWDVLIRDDAKNNKVQEEYISFLRGLFKGTEPTKYIALAYLTGILPIKKEKTQSALNNFDDYTIIDAGPFAEYMGFTEDEVKALCVKYNRNFDEVKRWYDGYLLGSFHVYNPKAVVSVMFSGDFKSYWSNTASYDLIVPLVNMNYDGLKRAVITMLSGSEVKVDVRTFKNDTVSFESKDDVMTYLIHLGYLAYNKNKKTAFIPNEEIREEMAYAVRKKSWKEMIAFTKRSNAVIEAVINEESSLVAEKIEEIHDKYIPSLYYNDENSLSSVITLAFLSSMEFYSRPLRELPTGKGFADIVYLPKPEYREDYPALLVELKWNKDALSAIDQIKEKNYPSSIKDWTDNILLVAVNYDKKSKKHECVIERL